jgi:hypothetical protein
MSKFSDCFRRVSPFRRCGRLIAGRAVLLAVAAALSAGAGPAAAATDVPWSSLTLQASRLGSTATAEVKIEVLPAAAEIPKFIDSARGQPFPVSGADVLRLTVGTTLDIVGGKRVRFENQLWFDPHTNRPLYLVRTRSGLKDYHQRFRFTRGGAFRLQREPASAEEVAKPPEFWTKLREHFYSYPSDREACSLIVETSMLIVLVGALSLDAPEPRRPLCVFHKRQVHRVSQHLQPARTVSFDYLEKRAGEEKRQVGNISAVGVSLASRPIGSYRGDVEDFFRDGTQLYFSPEDQLPLVVSGELPLIGRVDLRLSEIHLN